MQGTEEDNKRWATLQACSLPSFSSTPTLSVQPITHCFTPYTPGWMGIHQAIAHNSKTTEAAQTCNANREVWRKINAKGREAHHLLLLLFAFQEQDKQLLEAGAAGGSRRAVGCGSSRTEASLYPRDCRKQLYRGAAISDILDCLTNNTIYYLINK